MHKSYKKSLKKQSLKKKSLQKKHKNTKKRALAKKQRGGAGSAGSPIIMSSFSLNNMNNNYIKEYYKTLTLEELQNELKNIENEFVNLRNVPNLTNNSITSEINALKRKFKIIQEIIVSK